MWSPMVLSVVLAFDWQPVWVGVAGGTGVGLTALFSWLVARRRESGSVATSDAGTVFGAYDRAFERVEKEVLRLDEDNSRLRERVAVAEAELVQHRNCKERIAALESEVDRLSGLVNG